jgi:branched-subunit amino acid transport protein
MAENFLIIFGMALVTFLPRFLPLYVLTRLEVPRVVEVWLRYVPVSVLAALIVPGVLMQDRQFYFSFGNSYLLASVPAFLVASLTKNMLLTITAGMCVVLFLHWYMPV